MGHKKKNKQKSLKLRIANSGGSNAPISRAIGNFAIDLHSSGLFQKVSLTTDLATDSPEVKLVLTPAQKGPAHICSSLDNGRGLHVEKVTLTGYFNSYAGERRPWNALEMEIDNVNVKGYMPDTTREARKVTVYKDFVSAFGHYRPRTQENLLPKEDRRINSTFEVPVPTIRMFNDKAAAFLIGVLVTNSLLKGDGRNDTNDKSESYLPQASERSINKRQSSRRVRGKTRAYGPEMSRQVARTGLQHNMP